MLDSVVLHQKQILNIQGLHNIHQQQVNYTFQNVFSKDVQEVTAVPFITQQVEKCLLRRVHSATAPAQLMEVQFIKKMANVLLNNVVVYNVTPLLLQGQVNSFTLIFLMIQIKRIEF